MYGQAKWLFTPELLASACIISHVAFRYLQVTAYVAFRDRQSGCMCLTLSPNSVYTDNVALGVYNVAFRQSTLLQAMHAFQTDQTAVAEHLYADAATVQQLRDAGEAQFHKPLLLLRMELPVLV